MVILGHVYPITLKGLFCCSVFETVFVIPCLVRDLRPKKLDSGGIRTHATEVTGALNQRLRPLGHAILASYIFIFFIT